MATDRTGRHPAVWSPAIKLPCPLILASASPARAQLLHDAGFEFTQVPSNADEPPREPGEDINHYVIRLARCKSEAIRNLHPHACILTCDTVIQLDDQTLGKPRDNDHAIDMITRMAGRAHTVHTGVVLCSPKPERKTWEGYDSTNVFFKPLTDDEIHTYVERSQPYIYAGAYAIQKDGADLVSRIEGSVDTVIGLPVTMVRQGLKYLNFDISNRK